MVGAYTVGRYRSLPQQADGAKANSGQWHKYAMSQTVIGVFGHSWFIGISAMVRKHILRGLLEMNLRVWAHATHDQEG